MKPHRWLALYPRAWRERYGVEMLALIEQSGARGWRLNSDLLRACVGAWLMVPLRGQQPSQWLVALFIVIGVVGGSALIAFLTIWLNPAPIVWRAVIAGVALLAIMVRLFTKKFEAGRHTLAPELHAFEVIVLVVLDLVAGTLLHKPAPAAGLAGASDWLLFIFDSTRLGIPQVLLIFAIMRLFWPASMDVPARPTSTLGLSG